MGFKEVEFSEDSLVEFATYHCIIEHGLKTLQIKRGERYGKVLETLRAQASANYYYFLDDIKFRIDYVSEVTNAINAVVERKHATRLYKRLREVGKSIPEPKTELPKSPILEKHIEDCLESYIFDFWKAIKALNSTKGFGNRGALFCGHPGTGKSMTMAYIAKMGLRLFNKSAYHLGVSDLMKLIDKGKPLPGNEIIFVDDADASLLRDRKITNNPYTSKLLSIMDGTVKTEGRLVIFSTNEVINDIDPALTRSGRLQKVLVFNRPSDELVDKYVDQEEIGMNPSLFYGWTFAEVADFVNTAKVQEVLYGTKPNVWYEQYSAEQEKLKAAELHYTSEE